MDSNNDIQRSDRPIIVSAHDTTLDNDYASWMAELKHRYRCAQVNAAMRVNAEKLLFNWQLGRDLVQKKAEERWGAGVVEQISLDLRREFPADKGFSTSNLWYMKKWYLFYTTSTTSEKLQQLVGEMQSAINQTPAKLQHSIGEFDALHSASNESAEFPLPFALIPWGQHIEIITRCGSIEEALFYIAKTIKQGLSRAALINCIKADLYSRQGKIINNFPEFP